MAPSSVCPGDPRVPLRARTGEGSEVGGRAAGGSDTGQLVGTHSVLTFSAEDAAEGRNADSQT